MAEHPQPRLLIEEWLPAAAVGVECMRERGSASALAPHTYLHVWWARRPLCASRAAILASLLPADFPHEVFEHCLGMTGRTGDERVMLRALMDEGSQVDGGFGCERAFKAPIPEDDLAKAHEAMRQLWGGDVTVIDPMAGGGSIPLEAARLGLKVFANEYNPVACSVLEATIDYPFRFGPKLSERTRFWAKELQKRIDMRLSRFYPKPASGTVHAYIYARTVPCPDTGNQTPLVPDWHLLKSKGGVEIAANPKADIGRGTWTVEICTIGKSAGDLREVPNPTYKGGSGISLFTGRPIPGDWIKQKAQSGEMGATLYAIAHKTASGLQFRPPTERDLEALRSAETELESLRPEWLRKDILPSELYPERSTDERPRIYGMPRWTDLFTPRQLLALGTIVEEIQRLRPEINGAEGDDLGEAVIHLLAFGLDKFANWNAILSSWNVRAQTVRSVFDRHDFSWKPTFSELAAVGAAEGFNWAVNNSFDSSQALQQLSRSRDAQSPEISRGSATDLPWIDHKSMSAVVVDPPYDDNVQYSELADFFYVWLKRTQGHRHPDWFGTYLCEHDQEAVVNHTRHGDDGAKPKEAKERARIFYRKLMMETFRESRRILRDDGALTVMFTHKKQEAWEALFGSLVEAGFVITATWPVKTESEHSLHQAKKNAAQSTVILVARKRPPGSGKGYFTGQMQDEIRGVARASAIRLQGQGLNAVDQLVGSFGPAMEVYSRFDQVVTDTGVPVAIGEALDIASDAVSSWRVEQLAARGLDGVEAEGRFALLCWDVLGAEEFRFNEAKLLGHAVGMDVESLVVAGLVTKSGDKIKMVPARDRKREDPLKPEEIQTLFGTVVLAKKGKKKDVLKVHPGDAGFRTALDACHAMAIEYIEGRDPQRGIALVKALSRRHGWTKDSDAVRLMEALVVAAPEGVRFDRGKTSAGAQFPEFRAWHHILGEVFGLEQPEWKMKVAPKTLFDVEDDTDDEEEEGDEE